MSLPFDNNRNEAAAGHDKFLSPSTPGKRNKRNRSLDSSDRDSVSSARDNGTTEPSSLSHRSSPSPRGSCDQDTSFVAEELQKFSFHLTPDRRSSFEVSGSDFESSERPGHVDDNFAIARAAWTGQNLSIQDTGFGQLQKERIVVSDLGNDEYKSRKLDDHYVETSEEEDDLPSEAALQDKLLADHHKYHDGRKGFIPRGHIKKVINEQAVAQHLHGCLSFPSSRDRNSIIKRHVAQIFQRGPERKSYINIFAILVLAEKSECIGDFLMEGIDDSKLPFRRFNRKPQGQIPKVELRPRQGENRIKAFDRWSLVKKMAFEEWQWAVNAPFFHRGKDGEAKIFSLQDPAVLPFVKFNPRSGSQEIEEHHGGFGKVSKKYIHADHHSLRKSQKENSAFAVKEINSENYKDFKAEFDMLAKLGETNHPHLVSLLGAYCQLNNNYLIFDWADSDLSKYWQNHPNPQFNFETVSWVAKQCLGLASALQQIHRYGSIEQQKRSCDPTQPKLYGRHGDIKPENILWFSNPDSPKDRGTLRICDFGVSEFHTTQSRSGRGNNHVAQSPFYRPPECDLRDGKISRSYDIWTIGCLYLEFIAWLLGGWKLVREMVIARKSRSSSGDSGSNLDFDYPYFDINDNRTSATIKPAVAKFIADAHAHPKCSDFVHEFLDNIQKYLLVVETNDARSYKRIRCGRLQRLLQKMYEKCENKPEYAVKAKPKVTK